MCFPLNRTAFVMFIFVCMLYVTYMFIVKKKNGLMPAMAGIVYRSKFLNIKEMHVEPVNIDKACLFLKR